MEREPSTGSYIALNTSAGIQVMNLENYLVSKRVVELRGTIDESVLELCDKLLFLDSEKCAPITMLINSPGGSIDYGMNLIDVMKIIKSPIRTVSRGLAASMAAVIFAYGSKGERYIFPNSKVMIHEPLMGAGNSFIRTTQLEELSKSLKRTKEEINKILADVTGKNIREINKDTREDKYFKGQEAVDYGLADKVITESDMFKLY